MPILELTSLSGKSEQRKLVRSHPISIGRHSSNDIVVDQPDVSVMHCRIGWNGERYEVTAANANGVDLNGVSVHHALLSSGDTLRIGQVDVVFLETPEDREPEKTRATAKPATSRPVGKQPSSGHSATQGAAPRRTSGKATPPPPPQPARVETIEEVEELEEIEEYEEELEPLEPPRDASHRQRESLPPEDLHADARAARRARRGRGQPAQESRSLRAQILARLAGEPVRPGEQDVLRSPLVLSLTGGSVLLVLVAAITWFVISRNAAQMQFDAAAAAAKESKHSQAARLFDQFLRDHPEHQLAAQARVELGKAKIRIETEGSARGWEKGLALLEDFIRQERDEPDFKRLHLDIAAFARNIAEGAAADAQAAAQRLAGKIDDQRRLLEISSEARLLFDRYSPTDPPPVEIQDRLRLAYEAAGDAIQRREALETSLASMRAALDRKQTLAAIQERRQLLTRYPEFERQPQIVQIMSGSLDAEKSLVTRDDREQPASVEDHQPGVPAAGTLIVHSRTRTDEVSTNLTAFVTAKDCCYAVDTVTGAALWRRVIGFDPPFPPLPVETAVPAVLLFDTNRLELILLERRTGRLQWRQPLGEPISGPPLIVQGQIYLPTLLKRLYKIVLESGAVTACVEFPQPVLSPPVLLNDQEHLVVAGDAGLCYTLSLRPLECRQVSFIGHAAGTVKVPPMVLGNLLLLCENGQTDSSRLLAVDVSAADRPFPLRGTRSIRGLIFDTPILRGNVLLVPSVPQRVTALTVSDEPGRTPLTTIASVAVQGAYRGPLFLRAESDASFWMQGDALRRFGLQADSIRYDESEKIALGQASQPLQMADQKLFLGRTQPYHSAVLLTPVDPQRLTSSWRALVGASIIGWTATPEGDCLCITETGAIFRGKPDQLTAGGFLPRPEHELILEESLDQPLQAVALGDGRLAVWHAGPAPKLWIIAENGRQQREVRLSTPLQAPPVKLGESLLLPVAGRLQAVPLSGGGAKIDDFLLPVTEGTAAEWRQIRAISDDECVTLDSAGVLRRLQLRQSPVRHLAEVTSLNLPAKVQRTLAIDGNQLALADEERRLRLLDLTNFETMAETLLPADASNGVWWRDGALYVETSDGKLRCFPADQNLRQKWELSLDVSTLAGAPVSRDGQLLCITTEGDVLTLSPDEGKALARIRIEQPVTQPLLAVGEELLVPSVDGSIYRIPHAGKVAAVGNAPEQPATAEIPK